MTQPPFSVLPLSKPPRPGWVVPVVAVLAVVALAALGLAGWALTRAPVAPAITTTPPDSAVEACRLIDTTDPGNLILMRSIGAKAKASANKVISDIGNRLQDAAELAIDAPDLGLQHGVTVDAQNLRRTCVTEHYLTS